MKGKFRSMFLQKFHLVTFCPLSCKNILKNERWMTTVETPSFKTSRSIQIVVLLFFFFFLQNYHSSNSQFIHFLDSMNKNPIGDFLIKKGKNFVLVTPFLPKRVFNNSHFVIPNRNRVLNSSSVR